MAAKLTEKQLKEGWKTVKFGEIARNISERVEPGKTDLQVYVGLEHLDPGSLRITRRGIPDDVSGQKLRVKPGQIIFGKRRAYQKKVAVADFDGICSAHAMVLEAIPGKLKQKISSIAIGFSKGNLLLNRGKLSNILHVKNGYAFKSSNFEGQGIPIVRILINSATRSGIIRPVF